MLRPFPLGIVTRFQMWNCLHLRLVSKETGKGNGHGVGVEPTQIELVALCRLGHQFAPDEGPLVVDCIQRPPDPVVVQLLCPFDFGIQLGNGVASGPIHQVVQGSRIAEPRLGD